MTGVYVPTRSWSTIFQNISLSRDCSQVAFIEESQHEARLVVRLCGVERPEAIASLGPSHAENVIEIRFSPDHRELWLLKLVGGVLTSYHITKSEVARDGVGRMKVIQQVLEDEWSWVDLFSFGYRIGSGARWIEDSRGTKIFWLPPNWRPADGLYVRWGGNYLALMDYRHPVPIIIEFHRNPGAFFEVFSDQLLGVCSEGTDRKCTLHASQTPI